MCVFVRVLKTDPPPTISSHSIRTVKYVNRLISTDTTYIFYGMRWTGTNINKVDRPTAAIEIYYIVKLFNFVINRSLLCSKRK